MIIRKVNRDDFDYILCLQLQLEDAEISFDTNLKNHSYETNKGKEKIKKRINDNNNIFFVAVNEENKPIGFIDGKIPDDEWWYKKKVAYIDYLCVDEKYRQNRVATVLLNEFEQTAKKRGANYIRLLAFPKNKPAINFYKKNGFSEYSTYYNKQIL